MTVPAFLLAVAIGGCQEPPVRSADHDAPGDSIRPDERGLSPSRERQYALPLNNPSYVPAALAPDFLDAEDDIVGVVVAGRARAYPWVVLRNYHVVNDTVMLEHAAEVRLADVFWGPLVQRDAPGRKRQPPYVPLLVTLCEVCSGASAYVPRIESQPLDPLVFAQCRSQGSPAGHYNAVGTFTICDMQTHSRWHPFSGRAGSGPLAGQTLTRIPVAVEPWSVWLERYPDSVVITAGAEIQHRPHAQLDDGAGMGAEGAHASVAAWRVENPGQQDDRLDPHRLVMGVALSSGSPARAYTLEALDRHDGLLQDRLGTLEFAIFRAGPHRAAAFQRSQAGQTLEFELKSTWPYRVVDDRGNTWNEIGEAIAGPDLGATLRMVDDSYLAEWSDWASTHRGTTLVE